MKVRNVKEFNGYQLHKYFWIHDTKECKPDEVMKFYETLLSFMPAEFCRWYIRRKSNGN